MESFEGFRKSATFITAPGAEVQGDLILKGAKTTLDLDSKDYFSTHALKDGCILGALHDRTKVSLIGCITTQGLGSGSRGGERYHFASVFPHFVIFGNEHITSDDQKITDVSFHVDDAATLFHDFDAFGSVIDARPHIEKIVATKEEIGRDIAIGDDPMIFYFAGKYEIIKAETVLGTVSAEHRPSFSMPGPHGINVDNKIHVNIAFKEPATVQEAITNIHTLLRFLEVIAGRPQTVLRLIFVVPGPEDKPNFPDVSWSMSPARDGHDTDRGPHPADLPIQAAHTPEYFATVLTAWLARDHDWRSARFRFSTASALQRRFTIDRLVGAANMFDILPASAVPADVPLTKEMEGAKAARRVQFKPLPPSLERDSVLNALGRLGQASLKRKVRARAKLILDRIPARFPELELVIDEAVDCRNYFVHGSKAKMDYSDEFDQVIFFTEALEFIFAASDLIECGWNIVEWSKQSSTVSHPFDRLGLDYEPRLNDLKRALAAVKAPAAPASTRPWSGRREGRMSIHIEVPDIDEHPKGFPQFWLKRAFINSISTNYQVNALATTYVRLVEAALTEHRLGQAMLKEFWSTHTSLNLGAMHRSISHFENCLFDMNRAINCFTRLRRHKDLPVSLQQALNEGLVVSRPDPA